MTIKSFSIRLSLGYNSPIGGAYPGTPFEKLKKVIGDFEKITFIVEHVDVNTYRIVIQRKKVPVARGNPINITETVTGLIGDHLRLKYGEKILLLKGETQGVTVKVYTEK